MEFVLRVFANADGSLVLSLFEIEQNLRNFVLAYMPSPAQVSNFLVEMRRAVVVYKNSSFQAHFADLGGGLQVLFRILFEPRIYRTIVRRK